MSDLSLPNVRAVYLHVKGQGYKVSQSTVYKHRDEGRIPNQPDGTYSVKAVEIYAKRELEPIAGTTSKDFDELARRKIEAEVRQAEAKAISTEVKAQADQGLFIETALFEGELAARAVVLKQDLENFWYATAESIVSLCEGEAGKVPDVVSLGLKHMERILGKYATPKEWDVPLPEPKEEEQV